MKKNWPAIGEEEKNGKKRWVVDARQSFKGKRTGERRFFESRKEAEGYRQHLRTAHQNEGPISGIQELKGFGYTLSQAVEFTLKHLRSQRNSISLEEGIQKLVEAKGGAGFSQRRCRDLAGDLKRVSLHFNGTPMRAISTEDLEGFLIGLNVKASTRNKFRRNLILLWGFAEKRGWAEARIAKHTDLAREDTTAPMILTPQQAEALLVASSKDNELLAYHAIGLFAGLRVQEIEKLDWKCVDFQQGFIDVTCETAKTRTRRHAPLTDNLRAWLHPIAKTGGPIVTASLRRSNTAARTAAGITTWQENILRHSFVSYRLAALRDAARVALEAGHDQKVLFNHYLNVVTPSQAEQYFQICPLESEKIVPMVAGASAERSTALAAR